MQDRLWTLSLGHGSYPVFIDRKTSPSIPFAAHLNVRGGPHPPFKLYHPLHQRGFHLDSGSYCYGHAQESIRSFDWNSMKYPVGLSILGFLIIANASLGVVLGMIHKDLPIGQTSFTSEDIRTFCIRVPRLFREIKYWRPLQGFRHFSLEHFLISH